MRCNATEFLPNLCREIYDADPFYFDMSILFRDFFMRELHASIMRNSRLDSYLQAQADAYVAHRYQGGLYQ